MRNKTVNCALSIPKTTLLPAKGRIEATVITKRKEPLNIGDAFSLLEGEVLEVEAGRAIDVRTADGWLHADFYEDGRLIGPLMYAESDACSPRERFFALRHSDSAMYMAFGTAILVLLLALIFSNEFEPTDPGWIIKGLGTLIYAITYGVLLYEFFAPLWESEENIIGRLKAEYDAVVDALPWKP